MFVCTRDTFVNTRRNCFQGMAISTIEVRVRTPRATAQTEMGILDDSVVLVTRERMDEKRHIHRFSVEREGYLSRAIVTHKGRDDGGGSWRCSKDTGSCMHVKDAQDHLQRLLKGDPDATHDTGVDGEWNDPLGG